MKTQRGFTLVELLVTIAITGIIVPFLGIAIYQMVTVTDFGNDDMQASHELQNAGRWFANDGSMASEAATGPSSITFTIPPGTTVLYTLDGTSLVRTSGADTVTVARNITSVVFSLDDRLLSMELVSSPEGRSDISKTGTYQVYMRVVP